MSSAEPSRAELLRDIRELLKDVVDDRPGGTFDCQRCGALVPSGNRELHSDWHVWCER